MEHQLEGLDATVDATAGTRLEALAAGQVAGELAGDDGLIDDDVGIDRGTVLDADLDGLDAALHGTHHDHGAARGEGALEMVVLGDDRVVGTGRGIVARTRPERSGRGVVVA